VPALSGVSSENGCVDPLATTRADGIGDIGGGLDTLELATGAGGAGFSERSK